MKTPRPRLCFSTLFGCALASVAVVAQGQIFDSPDGAVAGIPANYTEAKVGQYMLPDLLTLAGGGRVSDAAAWTEKRRPEIFRLLEENQFGRCPEAPAKIDFDVFEKGTPALAGKAVRRQITLYFTGDRNGPKADVLLYVPADATGPVPVLLHASFLANNLTVEDPDVKVGERWDPKEKKRVPATGGRRFAPLDVAAVIARGFAVATVNYADFEPDAPGAIAYGLRASYLKPGQDAPAPDEWGTIAAWGWGLSRVVDYFETDKSIDAKRVAILGVSRLGKTVLWAGARDQRIALVIASCSGEGGAALSRRNYGETVAHLTDGTRYAYQFAGDYGHWAGRAAEAPFDAHMLVALMAPRPLLLQTGNTDKWSDPYGEFLAAKAATPVFHLFGEKGIEEYSMPPAKSAAMMNTLGYFMHDGGHGTVPADMEVFLNFMEAHLKTSPAKGSATAD